MTGLRPYQEECIKAVIEEYYQDTHQQLIVCSTGTGKTVIFSKLIGILKHFLPGKTLIFAHREELVDQTITTVRQWNPELKVGKEMADDYADADCDVVVACVASIGRSSATRLDRFGEFDVVICDEAHHSIADTYLNVFEKTGVLKPSSQKLLLGFTATPKRKNLTRKERAALTLLDDENLVSLKSVYKKIVYTYPIRRAIKEGWLVPLRGYRLKTDTDLSNVKITAGDYQPDELSETVNTPNRNAKVLKAWQEWGEERQTVGFTVDIKHAKDLASLFQIHKVKAEAVWGKDPERHDFSRCDKCGAYSIKEAQGRSCNKNLGTKEQPAYCRGVLVFGKGKIERHQAKEITVLFNAQVLTEGYDDWRVSCILLCAPTRNSSKYTQEIGRGTRLQAGIGNLLKALAEGYALDKRDCLIIDVVDSSKRCSLVTFPSLLGLNPEFDLHGTDVVKALEEMESLQDKYPGISLDQLTDLSKIEAYVESIDIFSDPCPDDVKDFSNLSWVGTQSGEYTIAIPEDEKLRKDEKYGSFLHEKLHVRPTELDEYELSITKNAFSGGKTTTEERKLGTFPSLKEAVETADEVLQRCRPMRMKLMQRVAPWHAGPATDAAKRYLKKLSKNRNVIYCLCPEIGTEKSKCPKCGLLYGVTAGQVAQAINRLQHTK